MQERWEAAEVDAEYLFADVCQDDVELEAMREARVFEGGGDDSWDPSQGHLVTGQDDVDVFASGEGEGNWRLHGSGNASSDFGSTSSFPVKLARVVRAHDQGAAALAAVIASGESVAAGIWGTHVLVQLTVVYVCKQTN